jgi:hypothetical protein
MAHMSSTASRRSRTCRCALEHGQQHADFRDTCVQSPESPTNSQGLAHATRAMCSKRSPSPVDHAAWSVASFAGLYFAGRRFFIRREGSFNQISSTASRRSRT